MLSRKKRPGRYKSDPAGAGVLGGKLCMAKGVWGYRIHIKQFLTVWLQDLDGSKDSTRFAYFIRVTLE